MTWQLDRRNVNDAATDEAMEELSIAERTALAHYMLGALAGHVETGRWANALENARRHAAGLDREGVSGSRSSVRA